MTSRIKSYGLLQQMTVLYDVSILIKEALILLIDKIRIMKEPLKLLKNNYLTLIERLAYNKLIMNYRGFLQ